MADAVVSNPVVESFTVVYDGTEVSELNANITWQVQVDDMEVRAAKEVDAWSLFNPGDKTLFGNMLDKILASVE